MNSKCLTFKTSSITKKLPGEGVGLIWYSYEAWNVFLTVFPLLTQNIFRKTNTLDNTFASLFLYILHTLLSFNINSEYKWNYITERCDIYFTRHTLSGIITGTINLKFIKIGIRILNFTNDINIQNAVPLNIQSLHQILCK